MTILPDVEQVIVRLDRIQQLADALAKARGDLAEQQDLMGRIEREIQAAKISLKPFNRRELT